MLWNYRMAHLTLTPVKVRLPNDCGQSHGWRSVFWWEPILNFCLFSSGWDNPHQKPYARALAQLISMGAVAAPAVGGFIVVVQMLKSYGFCTLIKWNRDCIFRHTLRCSVLHIARQTSEYSETDWMLAIHMPLKLRPDQSIQPVHPIQTMLPIIRPCGLEPNVIWTEW